MPVLEMAEGILGLVCKARNALLRQPYNGERAVPTLPRTDKYEEVMKTVYLCNFKSLVGRLGYDNAACVLRTTKKLRVDDVYKEGDLIDMGGYYLEVLSVWPKHIKVSYKRKVQL